MARVQADTLPTASGTGNKRNGRRTTNGNAARTAASPEEAAEHAAQDEQPEEAQQEPEPETPSEPADAAADAMAMFKDEKDQLVHLGKLTRFAIEHGMSVEQVVERFRKMVAAYDAAAKA